MTGSECTCGGHAVVYKSRRSRCGNWMTRYFCCYACGRAFGSTVSPSPPKQKSRCVPDLDMAPTNTSSAAPAIHGERRIFPVHCALRPVRPSDVSLRAGGRRRCPIRGALVERGRGDGPRVSTDAI